MCTYVCACACMCVRPRGSLIDCTGVGEGELPCILSPFANGALPSMPLSPVRCGIVGGLSRVTGHIFGCVHSRLPSAQAALRYSPQRLESGYLDPWHPMCRLCFSCCPPWALVFGPPCHPPPPLLRCRHGCRVSPWHQVHFPGPGVHGSGCGVDHLDGRRAGCGRRWSCGTCWCLLARFSREGRGSHRCLCGEGP